MLPIFGFQYRCSIYSYSGYMLAKAVGMANVPMGCHEQLAGMVLTLDLEHTHAILVCRKLSPCLMKKRKLKSLAIRSGPLGPGPNPTPLRKLSRLSKDGVVDTIQIQKLEF